MDNGIKLKVLVKIARQLNGTGITWAVGGSLLLFLQKIAQEFNDIDIMVLTEDAENVGEILRRMGKPQQSEPKARFKTKTFLEFVIDGVEVDVMAGFAIVENGTEHDCSLTREQIESHLLLENEDIPLHSVALWRQYYVWMGKSDKVRRIDTAAQRQ